MAHPDRFLLAGVMGWPVMHSRSPMLHNYWFKQHGLAGTYVPLAISRVVVGPDGSLAGTNNDCYGFVHNIRHEQPGWRADSGPVVVIGAGGGSRAVCYGLAQEGAKEIRLVNRSFDRAKGIAGEFGGPIKALPWDERHDALDGAAMVVNTTSCGMVGQPALDIRLDKLPKTALVSDTDT